MTKRTKRKLLNQIEEKLFSLRMWRENYDRLDLDLFAYGKRRYLNPDKRRTLARQIRELRTTRQQIVGF